MRIYIGKDDVTGQDVWIDDGTGELAYNAGPVDPWQQWFDGLSASSGETPYTFQQKYGIAQQKASELGLDPAQALQWFQSGLNNNVGTNEFAGALDRNNRNLEAGWGILGMLQGAGLTGNQDQMNWLRTWVDQGNTAKDLYNAQQKKDSMANLAKFAGLLGTAVGGASMLGGSGSVGGWTSGYDLPMGDSVGFFDDLIAYGSDAAETANSVSGGWDNVFANSPVQMQGSPEWGFNISAPTGTGFPAPTEGFWSGLTNVPGLTSPATSGLAGIGTASNSLWSSLTNGAKSLFGGFGELLGGLNNGGGLGGLLGTTVNAAPFLAALNYASNQDPYDTSRLESLYDQYSPQANTFEYDMNTGLGRNRLTSNLSRRGVLGSSFGNADLTSYDTLRELGREALINQGVGTSASLANSILNAQAMGRQQKNDLYGRALLGLGGALGGRVGVNT